MSIHAIEDLIVVDSAVRFFFCFFLSASIFLLYVEMMPPPDDHSKTCIETRKNECKKRTHKHINRYWTFQLESFSPFEDDYVDDRWGLVIIEGRMRRVLSVASFREQEIACHCSMNRYSSVL